MPRAGSGQVADFSFYPDRIKMALQQALDLAIECSDREGLRALLGDVGGFRNWWLTLTGLWHAKIARELMLSRL